jgi:hypothetical protein
MESEMIRSKIKSRKYVQNRGELERKEKQLDQGETDRSGKREKPSLNCIMCYGV